VDFRRTGEPAPAENKEKGQVNLQAAMGMMSPNKFERFEERLKGIDWKLGEW